MWKLSIADDQANTTVVNLTRDEYTVGRAEDSAVRLTERNISRRHARLRRQSSSWVIEDLESYNGCYVNGTRVGGVHPLEHGDLVQLGDYRLELLDESAVAVEGAPGATLPAMPRGIALLDQPDRLVMLVGPTPGAEFPLAQEPLMIGRGEECPISINHSSVSRAHAEIRPAAGGRYELLDKGSANGVRINGVELQQGLVDSRDLIELGDVVLKFIPAGQIYKPGADESQQIEMAPASLDGFLAYPPSEQARPQGLPPVAKLALGVLGLGALVLLGMYTLGGPKAQETSPAAVTTATDPAAETLAAAKALLDQGDLEGAHRRVNEGIPESSNARQSDDFREIEAKWADSLFKQASETDDLDEKKKLLDRIAKATGVDSTRRKQASAELEKLSGDGVDVSELPQIPKVEASQAAAPASAPNDGLVRKNPFDAPAPKAAAEPKTAAAPKAAPTPKAPPKNAIDDAASGDRAKKTAAKDALLAKANSGNASAQELRILRGLCRQLGDAGCAARAEALLASAK
ncbi:MAG: FHA domain-containing protein [Polyangiaceae bacterium]|nr:FHA domain-containing protein [Polyangiaceae bacterium]MCW5790738.1 FHA domain-containing protein [Polyangiaceae bacterium]